jgi:alkylated DNA repair dioxygenase AlkB
MSIDVAGVQGLLYLPEFITPSEEKELLAHIDREPWLTDLKRRVQHYGYKYDYQARAIDDSMQLGPIPEWLGFVRRRQVERGFFCRLADQVIINEYEPGQGITDHIDCEPCFGATVLSLSLGSTCVMKFTHKDTRETADHLLAPRSAVVLESEARYKWMHGIPGRKSDSWGGEKLPRGRRVSLTFRQVILRGDPSAEASQRR